MSTKAIRSKRFRSFTRLFLNMLKAGKKKKKMEEFYFDEGMKALSVPWRWHLRFKDHPTTELNKQKKYIASSFVRARFFFTQSSNVLAFRCELLTACTVLEAERAADKRSTRMDAEKNTRQSSKSNCNKNVYECKIHLERKTVRIV